MVVWGLGGGVVVDCGVGRGGWVRWFFGLGRLMDATVLHTCSSVHIGTGTVVHLRPRLDTKRNTRIIVTRHQIELLPPLHPKTIPVPPPKHEQTLLPVVLPPPLPGRIRRPPLFQRSHFHQNSTPCAVPDLVGAILCRTERPRSRGGRESAEEIFCNFYLTPLY